MFLIFGKTFAFLAQVSNLLVIAAIAAALALYFKSARFGRTLAVWIILAFLLVGFGPVGNILMRPLEDRFPRPPDDMPEPTGIIVLGGIINFSSVTRGVIALTQDGERLSEAAALAHRYPNAIVVYSGGTISNVPEDVSEVAIAKRFLLALGVDQSRIVLEGKSLSTAQNATFTRALVTPQPGQRWLLVTSASHMPRAIGSFRRAGFPVIAYPVGHTTSGLPGDYWAIQFEASANLVRADVALHEWIGLFAYWLTRRTDVLLPAPSPDEDNHAASASNSP